MVSFASFCVLAEFLTSPIRSYIRKVIIVVNIAFIFFDINKDISVFSWGGGWGNRLFTSCFLFWTGFLFGLTWSNRGGFLGSGFFWWRFVFDDKTVLSGLGCGFKLSQS